ncbi:MAG: hypothetical protein ACE5OZ_25440 [Candidatus Heimdallarchaeota archaeon]
MAKKQEIAPCDLSFQRETAMRLANAEMKELQSAGIPVTGRLFGEIIRDSWKQVREQAAKCSPADELTLEKARKRLAKASGK